MAQTVGNVLIGAATIYVDPYVAAGSAVGSPTEVGFTRGATTITPAYTDYEVKAEQAAGTIKRVNTDTSFAIKVPMIESTLEHWRDAFRQPAANLTGDGSSADKVLLVGAASEVYKQVKLAGEGLGSAATREVWGWKCIAGEVAELGVTKEAEQLVEVTYQALHDASVSTADKILKIVDAIT